MYFLMLIALFLVTCSAETLDEKERETVDEKEHEIVGDFGDYSISFVDEEITKRAGELFDVKINVNVNEANKQGEDFVLRAWVHMSDEASNSSLVTGGWHEVDKHEGGEITIKNVFFTNPCDTCQVSATIRLADCREEIRKMNSAYVCQDEKIDTTAIPAIISENPWSVKVTKEGDRGIAIQAKKDGHPAKNQQLTIMARIDSFSKNINRDLLPDFETEAYDDTRCNEDLWQSSGYSWLLTSPPIFAGQAPPSCRCVLAKQTITTDDEGRWHGEVAQYMTDNCWAIVQLITEDDVLIKGDRIVCPGEAPQPRCV